LQLADFEKVVTYLGCNALFKADVLILHKSISVAQVVVVNGRLLVFWCVVESSDDDQNSQQPAHVDVDS
jgi:hypothetical protein